MMPDTGFRMLDEKEYTHLFLNQRHRLESLVQSRAFAQLAGIFNKLVGRQFTSKMINKEPDGNVCSKNPIMHLCTFGSWKCEQEEVLPASGNQHPASLRLKHRIWFFSTRRFEAELRQMRCEIKRPDQTDSAGSLYSSCMGMGTLSHMASTGQV